MTPSTRRPRKLLLASAGLATLVYTACDGMTSSGNLVAPICPDDGPDYCCPDERYPELCCPTYQDCGEGGSGGGGSGGVGGGEGGQGDSGSSGGGAGGDS